MAFSNINAHQCMDMRLRIEEYDDSDNPFTCLYVTFKQAGGEDALIKTFWHGKSRDKAREIAATIQTAILQAAE